jgi:hypothetical protein
MCTRPSNHPKEVFYYPPLAVSVIMLLVRRGRHSGSWLDLRFSPLSHNIANQAPHVELCILALSLLTVFTRSSWCHFPNRCQWIHPQQHPALSKQLITRSCCCYCPHLSNISVYCHVWLLYNSPRSRGGIEGRPTSAYMASNSVESPACLCPSAAAILYCHGEYLKGMVQQCEGNKQG